MPTSLVQLLNPLCQSHTTAGEMAGFTIAKAQLASIIVHSALFGIYLLLFVGSLYILYFKPQSRNRRNQSRPMYRILLGVAILFLLLITGHWIIQIVRLFEAFIYHIRIEDPNDYYGPLSDAKTVDQISIYVMVIIVADATMVYRLYVVWGKNWRIVVVPLITTLLTIVAAVNAVGALMQKGPGVDFFSASEPWVMTLFSATLATNIIVTALIAYRIWSIDRGVTSASSSVMPVIHILLESAGIFTVFVLTMHISYLAHSNLMYIALNGTPPAIGISFSLIIVRVGLGLSTEERTASLSFPSGTDRSEGTAITPMPPVSVNISQQLRTHVDGLVGNDGPSQASKTIENGNLWIIHPGP